MQALSQRTQSGPVSADQGPTPPAPAPSQPAACVPTSALGLCLDQHLPHRITGKPERAGSEVTRQQGQLAARWLQAGLPRPPPLTTWEDTCRYLLSSSGFTSSSGTVLPL